MAFDSKERDELRGKFGEYAKTRDRGLRDELITAHMGLAEYLARRFTNRGEPLDDLVQVASLGLLKAVDRFDPERGLEFSTYATPTIVGELKRHFRDKGWAVRVPRRVQELHLRLGSVVSTLSQELGRSPTIGEIAHAAAVSEEEVLEAIEAGHAYRFTSLDAPTGGDEDASLASQLGSDDQALIDSEHRVTLSPLIAQFPPRERTILHLRFFEGLTQSEIAGRLGISQMHVSRLLARSLAQLRASADEP
ncbi:MAG: polymerase sigma-B factor [Actinomycetota bacterium]|jgi:RNA polymerase sigma-B factor|nr:polymerase sigma-B factor [Actinomycetota bacterium]MEA2843693.1 polymerase sigma-B factor [Actinomycetota bacterium]